MAAMTLPLIFWAFSMNSERRVNTTSSTPPSSPALTMFTYRRLNTFGCCANPSENVLPPSIASASSPMIFFKVGCLSCFSSTRKPRNSGRPASTSVANCRVKAVSTFDLTRPLSPGMLMLRFIPRLFLPAAFLAGLSRPFLSDFSRTFSTSTILVGNSPISFTRPMASF